MALRSFIAAPFMVIGMYMVLIAGKVSGDLKGWPTNESLDAMLRRMNTR